MRKHVTSLLQCGCCAASDVPDPEFVESLPASVSYYDEVNETKVPMAAQQLSTQPLDKDLQQERQVEVVFEDGSTYKGQWKNGKKTWPWYSYQEGWTALPGTVHQWQSTRARRVQSAQWHDVRRPMASGSSAW
mmetsp:Transcript_19700/g.44286  ORF Transcript_19700/g.44286 Transcript_19700/m.44286 type:complete len:133 (+) Transcript_19700:83-481(+)